jgi:hypothetical protein
MIVMRSPPQPSRQHICCFCCFCFEKQKNKVFGSAFWLFLPIMTSTSAHLQQQLLQFAESQVRQHGYPPADSHSLQEIGMGHAVPGPFGSRAL